MQSKSTSNTRQAQLLEALKLKSAVKVIAGIVNHDLPHVLEIVQAAELGHATAVDVSAKSEIVSTVRAATNLPVFASDVSPQRLAEAVAMGADAVELGNYDDLYARGIYLSEQDVLLLAQETVALVKGKALISITIPGHLALATQIRLGQALEAMGVEIIQTEGAARKLSDEPETAVLSAQQKAEITLQNTQALSSALNIPVMSATGITPETVGRALQVGAAAVGVGRFVSQQQDALAMTHAVEQIVAAVAVCQPVPSRLLQAV